MPEERVIFLYHSSTMLSSGGQTRHLDVLLEGRIDDHRNVDGDRELSKPWTGFHPLHNFLKKTPKGCTWSGERLAKVPATSRPDYVWPEVLSSMSKSVQNKQKNGIGRVKSH